MEKRNTEKAYKITKTSFGNRTSSGTTAMNEDGTILSDR